MPHSARIWSEGDDVHVDVRGLPPPEPFVAIMELIRDAPAAIVVHHEREPLPLFEALDGCGWDWSRLPAPDGEVRLRLVRRAA
jgi:hypothetical protein